MRAVFVVDHTFQSVGKLGRGMSISVLEEGIGVQPGVASVACFLNYFNQNVFSSMRFVFEPVCVAVGVTESSATLDDSVSEEEEEEGSYDELNDFTPYLQPGVELSVLNEVRLMRTTCHVATLSKIFYYIYPVVCVK